MEDITTIICAILAAPLIGLIYMAAVVGLLDYISKHIKNDKK